ncbi:copper chaperone CopZ [Chitinophaga dinghuensis]|uniref:Mercuric transport protein MerT n=1 Tax=Chitinophaga dinghuensis TaxID=1539050 RepID=A0A327W8E0_9BACT|nr:mercuric transporter MerT family protein [Chitinophaga dinghuensis]RAJ82308.1 copper chaperone CopZ [Chitinophaga dinghuensis]
MKKTLIAGSGIIAALLASTCCLSPLLALAGMLGIGVAQLTFLMSIKPYLIILSLMALGYNLYKAYQPANQPCCAVTTGKEKKSNNFFNSKLFLWTIIIITLLILVLPYYGQAQTKTRASAAKPQIKQAEYYVEKLTQGCCVGIVEYSLKKVDGYLRSEADVAKRQLVVWYDANKTSEGKIQEAIDKTPYKAVLKSVKK